MNRVNPRVETGQRLRDSGRFAGAGAATEASDGARDRASRPQTVKQGDPKPLRELALGREMPRRLGLGV